jgi:thiol oxidase
MAAPAPARLLALAVLLLVLAAPRGADALRSLGVGDGGGAVAQGDAAVDLNATGFDAFLGAAREPFAVVEFFAHWSVSTLAVLHPIRPLSVDICVCARFGAS